MSVDTKKMDAIERYTFSAEKIIESNENQFLSKLQSESKTKK